MVLGGIRPLSSGEATRWTSAGHSAFRPPTGGVGSRTGSRRYRADPPTGDHCDSDPPSPRAVTARAGRGRSRWRSELGAGGRWGPGRSPVPPVTGRPDGPRVASDDRGPGSCLVAGHPGCRGGGPGGGGVRCGRGSGAGVFAATGRDGGRHRVRAGRPAGGRGSRAAGPASGVVVVNPVLGGRRGCPGPGAAERTSVASVHGRGDPTPVGGGAERVRTHGGCSEQVPSMVSRPGRGWTPVAVRRVGRGQGVLAGRRCEVGRGAFGGLMQLLNGTRKVGRDRRHGVRSQEINLRRPGALALPVVVL